MESMQQITRLHALLFLLVTLLVAAALRFPDLAAAPPGVHYDEAANGILAAEIGLQGERPVFIPSYTGKEVLFFYLAGGMMRLLGPTTFALRLTAAFVGLLTLAATYWLGLELTRDRRVALLATALLAVSFWHLLFSRLGFRAITQPLLQALLLAALLRGLRTDRRGWLAAAGVFLGLTGYTYLAARLFPVLLLPAALPLLVAGERRRQRWRQLLLVAGVGLLVLLPLLLYFIANPDTFWVRITQVSPTAGLTLWESILRSLEMFFLLGDPYIRFNIPYRPLFNWFWGGLMAAGWLLLLGRWRYNRQDWQRTASLLLLLNPFIMLLPTALATNEIVPSNLRAIGLIPLLFYLPAAGGLLLLADLQPRIKRLPPVGTSMLLLTAVTLVLGGLFVERLYFRQWAERPDVYLETDADMSAIAAYLDEQDLTDTTVYVASPHYQHPTVAFLSDRYEQVKWLPESAALVFPPRGRALYLFPAKSPFPSWAADYFRDARLLGTPNQPDGAAAFIAYELDAPPAITVPQETAVQFGSSIFLRGVVVEPAASGDLLPITLFWQVIGTPEGGYMPFVHLEDEWGFRWSQTETFAYPAAQWAVGEQIVQRVNLPVPAGAPPGEYTVRAGLFDPATGDRLPRLDEAGRYAGNSIRIRPIPLTAAQPPLPRLPTPAVAVDTQVWPQLRLIGVEPPPREVATGERLPFALWWLAGGELPQTTTRIELLRADRTGRKLADLQPVHDSYPFTEWETPQFVIDRQSPPIPANFPPGEYEIVVRMLGPLDEQLAEFSLGPVTITATDRLFTPPAVENRVGALFGSEIMLLGYTLTAGENRDSRRLTLVWQAAGAPAADYTVFVHLLGADGLCAPCIWQQDVMPQQNQYPTSRWVADEIVVDTYEIHIPPETAAGEYVLEVGLYLAENGRRLQATEPGAPPADQVYLEPLPVE